MSNRNTYPKISTQCASTKTVSNTAENFFWILFSLQNANASIEKKVFGFPVKHPNCLLPKKWNQYVSSSFFFYQKADLNQFTQRDVNDGQTFHSHTLFSSVANA